MNEITWMFDIFATALLFYVFDSFVHKQLKLDALEPKEYVEGCDVCGSNCGQCGTSQPQRGNGEEVFDAAVNFISRHHK